MKKFSFLTFSLILAGFCMCVSCGYLLSTALVTSGIISPASQMSNESQIVYAISLFSNPNKNEVIAGKNSLQAQNGAGFVFEFDDSFHLLASVYENKADAELVKNNLSSQGVESEILKIVLPSKIFEGNFSIDEKNILSECLKCKHEIFKKLYDVAISLDTNILDKTKAKLECNNIYSSLVTTKANFDTIFKDKNLKNVEDELTKYEKILSGLISETLDSENQTFSSLIKLTYCKILLG